MRRAGKAFIADDGPTVQSARVTLLLWTALALQGVMAAHAGVGRTAGEFSVTSGGEARYVVDLMSIPGANGLTPAIKLVYRHRNGNGLLGVGLELPRFRGQVSVLVLRSSLYPTLTILPDSESAAAGGRSSAILARA